MSETHFYFSLEKQGGWLSAPSSQRAKVIETRQPKYLTVLDLDRLVGEDDPLEETLKIKYSGPAYFDWDCEDLVDGAASVNRFLDMLEKDYSVDLNCVVVYASGGRGYHAEVPFACFSSAKGGVQFLPQIYREIANDLYTSEMDMAIYSAKRGRMWRTPNVPRETGAFKVPLTLAEIRAEMTPERYAELCSAPRPFPELAEPTLSPQLASMFSDHQMKVSQRLRERAKKKTDDSMVKRMNGEWPESVLAIMRGENIGDVGLNKVAMQLGILSNALGKTIDQHIAACEGLIKTWKGDHATRRSVRDELKRIFGYVQGNPSFVYSPAAMAAIMQTPQRAQDLRGTAGAGTDPTDLSDMSRGIVIGVNGIFSMKDDTLHRETEWHFDPNTVTEIVDAESGMSKGYLIQGMDSGVPTQEMLVDPGIFISGDKLKGFLASKGAFAPGIDTIKAGKIGTIIKQSSKNNPKIKTLSKEGIHLLSNGELVWCSPSGCHSNDASDRYRFRSSIGSEAGNFQSDVMSAARIELHLNAAEVVEALMHFNNADYTTAALLGWFCACWQKPLHIALGKSFPILQAYGESGAGKTLMCMTLMGLFYSKNQPKMINASQGTSYGRRVLFSGSTSIPLLVDEFKPARMTATAASEFRMMLHEVYTPSFQAPRGGGDARSSAPGQWSELASEVKTTPIVFTTETAESETAIQERSIAVPFSKSARAGRADAAYQTLQANPDVIAAIGKLMLHGTAAANREGLAVMIERSHEVARERLTRSGNSRIVYNAGVALAGLGFFGATLRHVMPVEYTERFDARLDALRDAILEPKNYVTLTAAPEIIKILRFMTTISHQDDLESEWNVRHGIEYGYHGPECDLDINVDGFFLRYRTAAGRRSQSPAFQDPDSFLAALRSSSLTKEYAPPDTKLNVGTSSPRVVRLAASALEEYALGAFRA